MGQGELEEEDSCPLKVRAFFGLPVPDPQRAELARFIASSVQVAPSFRWTPEPNLHLTIRFIGNVERALVESVADAVAQRRLASFDIELGDLGSLWPGPAARGGWLGSPAWAGGR